MVSFKQRLGPSKQCDLRMCARCARVSMEVPVICNIAHEYKHSAIHTKQSIYYIYLTIPLKTPKKTHAHHAQS